MHWIGYLVSASAAGSCFKLDITGEAAHPALVFASCPPLCCCRCAFVRFHLQCCLSVWDPAVGDATCDRPAQSIQTRMQPKNDAGAWHYALCISASVTPTTSRPSVNPPAESRRWAVVESWQECRLLPRVRLTDASGKGA